MHCELKVKNMCKINLVIIIIVFIIYYKRIAAFNININNVVIYNDSQSSINDPTYFGYSVVLLQNPPRLQIGAPKTVSSKNSSNKPGGVYRCKFKQPCARLILKQPDDFQDEKDTWIGATMDVTHVDPNTSLTVICGYRWKIRRKNDNVLMNGICYVTDQKNVQILPLINDQGEDFQNYISKKNKTYNIQKQASCQAGFSAHFTNNIKLPKLLLGAPGMDERVGAPILYKNIPNQENKFDNLQNNGRNRTIFHFLYYDAKSFDGYLGYQVTTGNFYDSSEVLHVASAPRSLSSAGKVYIMSYPEAGQKNINVTQKLVKHTIEGTQIGEYFGASLAVVDINNDKLDDLIVGSPFYSSKYMEEGRVYIYLGHKTQFGTNNNNFKIILDGPSFGGRFGSTITSLGDIDGDGYSDFAVGAPNEDDHRGAIYIYKGNKNGISKRKQTIRAMEINPTLKGFGISIAKPLDLDDNKYNDLAIGAYLSGQVVVLRAYPTAVLRAILETNTTTIKRNETKFSVDVCIEYNGKNIPRNISIIRNITIDTMRINSSKKFEPKTVVLTSNDRNCDKVIFVINNNTDNFLTPISIILKIEVIPAKNQSSLLWLTNSTEPKGNDLFSKETVIINDELSQLGHKLDMFFEKECANSSSCIYDFKLEAEFLSNSTPYDDYVIGSRNPLTLGINITNNGDAFYSNLIIELPYEIGVMQPSCLGNASYLNCQLPNRFEKNQIRFFSLQLDMNNFEKLNSYSNLVLKITITTKSNATYNNTISKTLKLIKEVDIQVTGKAIEETYLNSTNKGIESISFEHSYEIQKFGPSPVENVLLKIYIPTNYELQNGDSLTIALINNVSLNFGGQPISCEIKNETEDFENNNITNTYNESKFELITRSVSENRTLFLSCFNNSTKCSKTICSISPFIQSDQAAKLDVKMSLPISLIQGKLIGNNKFIEFSTHIFVEIKDSTEIKYLSAKRMHSTTVTTLFSMGFTDDQIALWIVLTAAVVGALVLLLLIFILAKLGFFRREKKEKLVHLIEERRKTLLNFESFNYEECLNSPE